MAQKKLSPIRPGEILKLEFLQAFGISQYRLAKEMGVPARRINDSPRAAQHFREYVVAGGALLWDVGPILDQPAVRL